MDFLKSNARKCVFIYLRMHALFLFFFVLVPAVIETQHKSGKWKVLINNLGVSTMGLHLLKPCCSTFIHGIWNNTPIFKKYWKIPPKIIFFNPLPIFLPNLKKPLFSLYIACIHFYIYIFLYPFIFLPSILTPAKKNSSGLKKDHGQCCSEKFNQGQLALQLCQTP